VPVLLRALYGLSDKRGPRKVQDGVEVRGEYVHGVVDVAGHESGTLGDPVAVPGGQIIQNGHFVPCSEEERGDHAPDVSRAAGDEQFPGVASRSRRAVLSGATSLMNTSMPDSVPARYLSFPGARRTENSSRRNRARSRPWRTGAWCQAETSGRGVSNRTEAL